MNLILPFYCAFGAGFAGSLAALSIGQGIRRKKSQVPARVALIENVLHTGSMFLFDAKQALQGRKNTARLNENFIKMSTYYNTDISKFAISSPVAEGMKSMLETGIVVHDLLSSDPGKCKIRIEGMEKDIWALTNRIKREDRLFKEVA